MGWLEYSLAAMAFLSIATISAKILSNYPVSPSLLFNERTGTLVLAFVFCSLGGSVFYLSALAQPGAKTTLVAVVTSLNVVLIAMLSNMLFSDVLSPLQVAGVALAFLSLCLIAFAP